MKENFAETLKNKTENELEIISKDRQFYTSQERMLALAELEERTVLNDELMQLKVDLQDSLNAEQEDALPRYTIGIKDLYPRTNYFVTPILIYTNIIIFIIMGFSGVNWISPTVQDLINWGGNLRHLTINGEYWRLLTSIFIHGGLMHLVFNLYALLYVGAVLEKSIGQKLFFFAYLATGVAASLTSLTANDGIVSVGASGAIFGLFGILFALLLFKEFKISDASKKNLTLSIGLFILYNIVYGFRDAGIDNAAHLGGLISGFILGMFYYLVLREKIRDVFVYTACVGLIATGSVLAFTMLPDNYSDFEKAIEQFTENEKKATWMHREQITYNSPEQVEYYYNRLQTQGIDLWEENLEILNNLHHVPSRQKKKVPLLKEYCELRIQSCRLMQDLILYNRLEDQDKFKSVVSEIENIIQKITDLDK